MTDHDKRAAEAYWTNVLEMAEPKYCANGAFDVFEKGYLAGLKARDEQLLKLAPDFDEDACWNDYLGDSWNWNHYLEGARWQFEQGRLREAALRQASEAEGSLEYQAMFNAVVKERDVTLARYAAIERANKELSRNDHVVFGELLIERDRLKRELAEAHAKKETLMQAAAESLTAERERAKNLVEALEKVDELSKVRHSGIQSGQIARDALAAYRNNSAEAE